MSDLLHQSLQAISSSQELLEIFPDTFDLNLTPLHQSSLPPVLSRGTKQCLKDAVEHVKQWWTVLSDKLKVAIKLGEEMSVNEFYFITKLD